MGAMTVGQGVCGVCVCGGEGVGLIRMEWFTGSACISPCMCVYLKVSRSRSVCIGCVCVVCIQFGAVRQERFVPSLSLGGRIWPQGEDGAPGSRLFAALASSRPR